MAFQHDSALLYDYTLKGQLGDILFFDDCVGIPIFGSKTDQRLAGQQAVMQRSVEQASGCAVLLQTVCLGMESLLAIQPPTLAAIASRFAASNDDPSEALATWPADIRTLAARLYAAGVAAHRLPIYGWRLFDDFNTEWDL
jgi:hypothetical protein